MFIGEKIKAMRKAQKISLTELSEKSGVQMATLSRMEHKKMVGTLESHINIARALGTDVTKLYEGIGVKKNTIEIEKPESLTEHFTHSEKSSYEILTKKVLDKKMMPILIRIEPGGETTVEQGKAISEKFVFVLEGNIEVIIKDQSFTLEKAHTLYFDASLPHQFKNNGQVTARVLSIATPVTL